MPKKIPAGPSHHEYMGLDKVLNAQRPLSFETENPVHDEMLFIVSQQVFELWFKQILFDLDSVLQIFKADRVAEKDMGKAVTRLGRIVKIQRHMLDEFDILETMTPLDFLEFRTLLVSASGFQSQQFRQMEMKFGVKYPPNLKIEGVGKSEPSLFERVENWLERTPFLHFKGFDFWKMYRKAVEEKLAVDQETIEQNRDFSDEQKEGARRGFKVAKESFENFLDVKRYNELRAKGEKRLSHKAAQAALLIFLYRDQPILQMPFALLTQLVDIDDLFAAWRHQHAMTVFRMIGNNLGSGYTSGYAYLRSSIDSRRIFTDFANISTYLIPRSTLPELPKEVVNDLGFAFSAKEAR